MRQLIVIGSDLHTPYVDMDDSDRRNIYGMKKAMYEAEYVNRIKGQNRDGECQ